MADLFTDIAPLRSALDYHLDRHNVLASNIAHVDTPGYVSRDLARVADTSFQRALDVSMTRTQAGHLQGAPSAVSTTGRVFDDPAAGAGNDKNSVSLDREAAKIAANQLRYDAASALASAELAQLAYAAGDGRGT
jgi:flagellar basal-body rod protein FlgB